MMLKKCCHGLKIAPKTDAAKFYGEKQDLRILLTAKVLKLSTHYFYLVAGIV